MQIDDSKGANAMLGFYTEADYENSIIELFQNMAPVDGTLEELLIDGEQVPNEAENRQ